MGILHPSTAPENSSVNASWGLTAIALALCVTSATAQAGIISRLKDGEKLKIAAIGTSLTDANFNAQNWFAQMGDWLMSQYPGQVTLVNRAVSGTASANLPQFERAHGGFWQLDQVLSNDKPDAIFIEFAINDAYKQLNMSPANSRGNLRKMIAQINAWAEKNGNRVDIVVQTMNNTGPSYAHAENDVAPYYQAWREEAAASGVLLIDHYPNWISLYNKDPNHTAWKEYIPDDIHPNTLGTTKVILPEIQRVLKEQEAWAPMLVAPQPCSAPCIPSPRQLAYQERQLGAFVHFGLPTYAVSDEEYAAVFPWNPQPLPDVSRFNPSELDAEQWVLAVKSFGAKHLVFPAKHHDGFCLWPTKTTDYSVRSTPWKNGQGDIVCEVADACKKHGIAFGIYCSPADKHYGCYSTQPTFTYPPTHVVVGDRDAYFSYYKEQLRELLTNYGDVVMVWFDCWGDPFDANVTDKTSGKVIGEKKYDREIISLIRSLQPGAVVLRYWIALSDLRPVGGEDGTAPYPVWNVVRKGGVPAYDRTLSGTLPPEAEGWYFCESDLPTRPKWIWRPNSDDQLLSVDRLLNAYYNSIGRGSNILINATPDTRGLIPEAEVQRLAEFGAALQRRFGTPIARTDSNKGWTAPGVLELDLGRKANVAHIVLEEDIAKGQHVLQYAIDAKVGDGWKQVAQGESISRKRIERLEPPIATDRLRLRILKADAIPTIREMAAMEFNPPPNPKLVKLPFSFRPREFECAPVLYKGRPFMGLNRLYKEPEKTALYFRDLITGEEGADIAPQFAFSSAFANGDEINVFATEVGSKEEWTKNIHRFSSTDMKTWKQEVVITPDCDGKLFNTSVCQDDQGYIMAYESNKPVQWSFRFARSKDLSKWEKVSDVVFADVGGQSACANPVIRYFAPYYYVIYGAFSFQEPQKSFYQYQLPETKYITVIARSRDLAKWDVSPTRRPMLDPAPGEGINNTDADLFEYEGNTYVYYVTGDQSGTWGTIRAAMYAGPMKEMLEAYFPPGVPTITFDAKERKYIDP